MSLEELFSGDKVSYLDLPDVISVEASTPLKDALQLMRSKKVGALPVLEGHSLVGIFTERDHLFRCLEPEENLEAPVSDFMTKAPRFLSTEAHLSEVLELMGDKRIRHVPLFKAGKITSMISVRDLLEYLTGHYPTTVQNLPPNLEQHLRQDGG